MNPSPLPSTFSASSSRSSISLWTSHPIALSRRARLRPACSASAQFGVNGLSGPCGLTTLASAWLVLNATSNLLASSSCAACSASSCMFLLPSEYPSPPRPPRALLSARDIGVGPRVGPTSTLLLVGHLRRFLRRSASVQLPTQLVALTFCLFASPALLGHPFVQRGLRHLAAGPLGAELLLSLSTCKAGLCPIRGFLDRPGVLWSLLRSF